MIPSNLSRRVWEPCGSFLLIANRDRKLIKLLKTARSEEGSLRDEIPQAGLGGRPAQPMREAPISKNLSEAEGRKSQGALARLCEFSMPEATIEILIHSNRTFLLIPTGCALR